MDTVVVTLPFKYRVDFYSPGRVPGRHAETSFHVRDVHAFSVPSVTDAMAPVCMVWHRANDDDLDARNEDAPSHLKGRRSVEFRAFEGRFYARAGASLTPDGLSALAMTAPAGKEYRSIGLPHLEDETDAVDPWARDSGGPGMGPPTEDELFAAIKDRDRLKRRVRKRDDQRVTKLCHAAKAYAEGVLFVDGEAWTSRPGTEPRYYVRHMRSDTYAVHVRLKLRPYESSVPFPADRRDDALAFATSLNGSPVDCADRVDVVDPSVPLFDAAAYAASAIAHRIRRLDSSDPTYAPARPSSDAMARLLLVEEGARDDRWSQAVLEAYGACVTSDRSGRIGTTPTCGWPTRRGTAT